MENVLKSFLPGGLKIVMNTFHKLLALQVHFCASMQRRIIGTLLCITVVSTMLAACGTSTTAVKSTPTPTPTHVIAPTPTPTPTRVPTPMPSPTPTHVPTSIPTQVPTPMPIPVQTAPAVLDLRPASMSIVGHFDCQKNGAFVCFARVLSRSSNQSDLHWTAFTNVPGGITFSPAGGVVAPNQSVLVTITVPFNACTPGLFFFQGPINTHTITWAC
jgi:hypothetical protein